MTLHIFENSSEEKAAQMKGNSSFLIIFSVCLDPDRRYIF